VATTTSPKGVTVLEVAVHTSEPLRLHPIRRIRELWGVREILGNLIRKEVKVKYTSSVLGALWSLLNPVLYLAVFSLVFAVVLPNKIPNFPVYLLSGILAWNFFSNSLGLASRSVVDNANLVTKVYFPREILPLASVGAASVDFGLQSVVLLVFMAAIRYPFLGANLLLLPLALLALYAFTVAMSLWVAALNVRYRDTQHLLNIGLTLWFWLTPIVYPSGFVYHKLLVEHHAIGLWDLFLANPMGTVILGFQRGLYRFPTPLLNVVDPKTHVASLVPTQVLPPVGLGWLAMVVGAVAVGSLVLMLLAWRTFFHMSGDFAEEL
jgi:ABC-2 type transport system permease protein